MLLPKYRHFGVNLLIFERAIASQCLNLAQQYPVITVMGPRQSGKTTLVRQLFSDYAYINLESPEVRELAARDPKALLARHDSGLIIDEIQNFPELLSYIQVLVDEKQQMGSYILTGSHQISLHEAISQSLAGRTAILQLLPMSLAELMMNSIDKKVDDIDELMLLGGYPRVHATPLAPTQMYRDYVQTYLEKDVRQMINLKDLLLFRRFLKLCASRTGQVLNMNSLSNDLGISHHTIKHWLSILQASYLIQLLPAYYENFGKQIIKSPKLYFTDVGLACYLLDIEDFRQVNRDPLRGHLFETLVVMELVKARLNQARDPNLYFYRDSQKNEVDIIYKRGVELIPIEIKSAQTITRSYFKGLDYFKSKAGDRAPCSYLIYSGKEEYEMNFTRVLNFWHTSQLLTLSLPKD